jgi:hypothetical protein
METLEVLAVLLLMAGTTVHTLPDLLPSRGVSIVLDAGVTIRARQISVDGALEPHLGDVKGNLLSGCVHSGEIGILVATETQGVLYCAAIADKPQKQDKGKKDSP